MRYAWAPVLVLLILSLLFTVAPPVFSQQTTTPPVSYTFTVQPGSVWDSPQFSLQAGDVIHANFIWSIVIPAGFEGTGLNAYNLSRGPTVGLDYYGSLGYSINTTLPIVVENSTYASGSGALNYTVTTSSPRWMIYVDNNVVGWDDYSHQYFLANQPIQGSVVYTIITTPANTTTTTTNTTSTTTTNTPTNTTSTSTTTTPTTTTSTTITTTPTNSWYGPFGEPAVFNAALTAVIVLIFTRVIVLDPRHARRLSLLLGGAAIIIGLDLWSIPGDYLFTIFGSSWIFPNMHYCNYNSFGQKCGVIYPWPVGPWVGGGILSQLDWNLNLFLILPAIVIVALLLWQASHTPSTATLDGWGHQFVGGLYFCLATLGVTLWVDYGGLYSIFKVNPLNGPTYGVEMFASFVLIAAVLPAYLLMAPPLPWGSFTRPSRRLIGVFAVLALIIAVTAPNGLWVAPSFSPIWQLIVLALAGVGIYAWKLRHLPITNTHKVAFICSLVWLLYVGLFDPFSVFPYPHVYFIASFILGLPMVALVYEYYKSKFSTVEGLFVALLGVACVIAYIWGFYWVVKGRKSAALQAVRLAPAGAGEKGSLEEQEAGD